MKRNRPFVPFHLAAIFYGLAISSCLAERPNILFILVDDLGWTDLGCYGHPWHETPSIDQLASEGMRFTQAYSPAPICSSARASILTGKTPARLGLEFVVKAESGNQNIEPAPPLQAPPFTLALALSETTIAEGLQTAGYETAFFGKWHLNPHYQRRYLGWSPTQGPANQGFEIAEEDFGSHPYSKANLSALTNPGQYHPDGITERAIRYLQSDHTRPVFLMVSHFYVHTPVESPYDWLRKKYQRKIPSKVPNRERRIEYAAFVETLDHHVGELLGALDSIEQGKDTLVVFLSDNGGHPEYTSHAPLRGSKWNCYEGGIRVPMLVRWPGKVPKDSVCETPVIGYDLFPTFLSAAEFETVQEQRDGANLLPLFDDPSKTLNRSLYWHFPYYHPEGPKFGRAKNEIGINDFAVSQTRPHTAIRQGDYKLLWFQERNQLELYHLANDPSELKDLRNLMPDKSAQLKTKLVAYLTQVNARFANKRTIQP